MIKRKIAFVFICFFVCGISLAQKYSDKISLNQLGFYPGSSKIAAITDSTPSSVFFIVDAYSKDTVYRGLLSDEMKSENSSLKVRIADFSGLKKKGFYSVFVAGSGNSYPFAIADHVHHAVAVAALKGFYYQRASVLLEKKFAGKWARGEGHPDTAVFIHPSAATNERPAGTKISTPGGWYDAGDYNKYIVNSGITMGTLLSAYEDFHAYFDTIQTNIPESNNMAPDILDEVVYNLRWMLTMQDPADGGVYNKCTNAAFDKMVMPGKALSPRYVVQKGTAATLDFAAVTAQASRVLKYFTHQWKSLADSCLFASVKAWKWAEKNPDSVYDQNEMNKKFEPKITTGPYGDRHFDDERFWAAAELFITSQDSSFYKVLEKGIRSKFVLPSWSNVQALGFYSLMRNQKSLPSYTNENIQDIKSKLIQFANDYVKSIPANAFKTVMGGNVKDFIWGSNSVAANQGIVLVNTYRITKEKKYLDAALSNLDYILGRNATGYSFVTGFGMKSTMHPHHRPSIADGIAEPVPGLMAAGPNPGRQDHCYYEFIEPETAYIDTDCAFASNEIAINWNAPFVYLANAIEFLQYEAGYSK
ncbi:MAG TPA: glycoside hydrolase family 9 protein [Puia sp.]|nr:glycoside hydrolase family 9 protein [Puia sp.]